MFDDGQTGRVAVQVQIQDLRTFEPRSGTNAGGSSDAATRGFTKLSRGNGISAYCLTIGSNRPRGSETQSVLFGAAQCKAIHARGEIVHARALAGSRTTHLQFSLDSSPHRCQMFF